MTAVTDDDLVSRARAGDADARRVLVERSSLRVARAILGGKAADRYEALRDLANGDGPAPAIGPLLAAIVEDDGEARRAAELVHRGRADRWGPAERAAIGRFAARGGARLGPEHALELLGWAARFPDDCGEFVRGAVAALADVADDAWQPIIWRAGFEALVVRERDAIVAWSAAPASARAVALALLSAHARKRESSVPALDAIWARTARRDVWAAALGDAIRQNSGMSGRAEIAAWGWQRFCAEDGERAALYAVFVAWRDEWMELRNAMPVEQRPGGASAVAHLLLWGGLDIERLSATIEEAARLARDPDWAGLVDAAFDLAEAAPAALRRHALGGACKIGHEVSNRARDSGAPSSGIEAASDRFLARAGALAQRLRSDGAVIDPIVANRAEDLETDARLIREARERRAASAAAAAERAAAAEAQRAALRAAEAARQAAEAARLAAAAELLHHAAQPGIDLEPIDREIFFSSLPARSLLDYARLFKRMTSGDPMPALAAEGVTLEMMGVISQTWTALFARRTDLALRFSQLITAPWR